MTDTSKPMAAIVLRAPSTTVLPQPPSFTPPSLDWLQGTWHVTHSTLPTWKSKRNVSITYKPQAQSTPQKVDDVVSYQSLTSTERKTVVGVDTMNGDSGDWNWRGTGWLAIASSHWEILGYGDTDGGNQWALTYFAKTLFTPAGIDVYSRQEQGLGQDLFQQIRQKLAETENDEVKELASKMFMVRRD